MNFTAVDYQLRKRVCPGYIVVGDSLLHPTVGPSVLLPVPQEGQEIWYTPSHPRKLLDYADDLAASGKYIKSDPNKLGKAKNA